jgi:hypothetical protein
MALAVAMTTQRPWCIEIHSKQRRAPPKQELPEPTLVAAALRARAAITHGTHTLE